MRLFKRLRLFFWSDEESAEDYLDGITADMSSEAFGKDKARLERWKSDKSSKEPYQ